MTAVLPGFRMLGSGPGKTNARWVPSTFSIDTSLLCFEVFMARDRNVYVWQAYVTVMSIVSFACLGALAFVLFSSGTNEKAVLAAVEKEQKAQSALREENNRKQILQAMLGVGKPQTQAEFESMVSQVANDEELKSSLKKYNDNMALMGTSATDRNYTNLVDLLVQELRARNMQMASAGQRELLLKDEFDTKLTQVTKSSDDAKLFADEMSNKREKDLVEYTEKIKAQEDRISKIEADKMALIKQMTKKNADLAQNNELAKEKIGKMEVQLAALSSKLNDIQGEDFQYVQGKVINVASGADGDLVYISLGKSHNLKPGVIFGVIGSDVSRVADAKPKASIEVIRVIEQNLSICKVVPGKASIILSGDSIYSPAWQPNKVVEFALVGKMDLNGDGKDDRNTVKALIEQSGGKVTADLTPEGILVGQLSVDTRWMVVGEDFKSNVDELASVDKSNAKKRSGLESEAKSLGITRINLDKLMGWLRSSGSEVSALGTAMQPKVLDYKSSTSQSSTNGRVSPIFMNRDGSFNREGSLNKAPAKDAK